jgi:phosphate starvation-inducible protein PhoH and related proteins
LLKGVRDIRLVFFSNRDVVRHRLVQEIILAYERAEERRLQAANSITEK